MPSRQPPTQISTHPSCAISNDGAGRGGAVKSPPAIKGDQAAQSHPPAPSPSPPPPPTKPCAPPFLLPPFRPLSISFPTSIPAPSRASWVHQSELFFTKFPPIIQKKPLKMFTTPSLFLLCCLFFASGLAEKSSRAKRFAAFGSLSTVGGRVGCVVSQNKLFINGHFTKDLSEDEQEELKEYQSSLNEFKDEVKQYLEQRQAQLAKAAASSRGSGSPEVQQQQPKKPEPPKKPSFCSDKATTQYVFDGCSVQGDNVFIGDTFVRKLVAEEQQELEQFDRQFTAYQKAITADFRKKVQAAFGEHFGSLFGLNGPTGGASGERNAPPAVENAAPAGSAPGNFTAPEAPKTPSFCTLIV